MFKDKDGNLQVNLADSLRKRDEYEFQKRSTYNMYSDVLLQKLCNIIEYDGFPESVNVNFIERYRFTNAAAAIWKYDGEYITSTVDFVGAPDVNGIGSDCICITKNGKEKRFANWKENKDVAVIFLNKMYDGECYHLHAANMLTETDTSIKSALFIGRAASVPVVDDENERRALERVYKDIDNGRPTSYVGKTTAAKFAEQFGLKDSRGLDFTDATLADKLQYYGFFKDNVYRWFLNEWGMSARGNSKMAQQTEVEVSADDEASFILPLDILARAKEGAEMCNQKFGFNVTARFSEPWRKRYEEIFVQPESEEQDPDENKEGGNGNESERINEASGDSGQPENV